MWWRSPGSVRSVTAALRRLSSGTEAPGSDSCTATTCGLKRELCFKIYILGVETRLIYDVIKAVLLKINASQVRQSEMTSWHWRWRKYNASTIIYLPDDTAQPTERFSPSPKQYLRILTFCWPCNSAYLSQYLTNLMHKICFTVSFISCLYMFRAHVLIIWRSKLHYTASGIITLKQVSGLKLLK